MGQYYKVINIDDMEHLKPHAYSNGAKLMEHSYIGNDFVGAVEFLLADDGEVKNKWSGKRVIWAGDYADKESDTGLTMYNSVSGGGLQMIIEMVPDEYKYILNLDKKLYVNKNRAEEINSAQKLNKLVSFDDYVIHPLPLLVCEGNGRGGGDYLGFNKELVGTWARDRISLMKTIPDGFTELIANFCEG